MAVKVAAPMRLAMAATPMAEAESDHRDAGTGYFDGHTHIFPVRIYYEDTDAAGIVYYANYFRLAERARTEMMRLSGSDHRALLDTHGLMLAVRRCAADYRKPAALDDRIEIRTRMNEAGGARFRLFQDFWRDDEELVRMTVELACLDGDGRPRRLPDDFRASLGKLVPGESGPDSFSSQSGQY